MANIILLSSFLESTVEHWRAIEGFPGYEVSNLGKVRSFWIRVRRKGHRSGFENVLSVTHCSIIPRPSRHGYLRVGLYRNGRALHCSVHRLVAKAFIQNSESLPEVNHKNFITNDNRVSNLEWATRKFNSDHSAANGRRPRGSSHKLAKVTEDCVREIRRRCASGEMQKVVAQSFGIKQVTVSAIVQRRLWRHVE